MTDRELMQQALDALFMFVEYDYQGNPLGGAHFNGHRAIEALRARLAQPEPEPVAHSVVAGALFDSMGWLTSRKERIVLSSADNASPAVEVITEFAKRRGLSLNNAKVQDWHTAQPQREWQGLTDEERDEIAVIAQYDPLRIMTVYEYRVAIQIATEAKLKEKNCG